MNPFKKVYLILLLSLGSAPHLFAEEKISLEGLWLTEAQNAHIEIFKKNQTYFGKIVWLKERFKNGQDLKDKNNPNPALQSQTILGLLILKDFICPSEDHCENGTIYDPNNGKTYLANLKLKNQKSSWILEVRGYMGNPIFGKTQIWTRVQSK